MTDRARTIRTRTLTALLAAALALPATAGGADAASTRTVTLKGIAISPAKVTITRGQRVRWLWRDGSIRHDVTFSTGGLRSSPLKSKGSYTLTFRRKGTFRYVCTVHPGDMKGRVVVR